MFIVVIRIKMLSECKCFGREEYRYSEKNTQKHLNTVHRLQSSEWVAQLLILDIWSAVFPLNHWLSTRQLHSSTSSVIQRQRTHCSFVLQVVTKIKHHHSVYKAKDTNKEPTDQLSLYINCTNCRQCENPFEIGVLQWSHSKVNWVEDSQRVWLMVEIICLSTFLA